MTSVFAGFSGGSEARAATRARTARTDNGKGEMRGFFAALRMTAS